MRFILLLSVGLCFRGRGVLCEGAAGDQGGRTASPPSSSAPALPARIVVADGATETERWAADRLAELLVLPTDHGEHNRL